MVTKDRPSRLLSISEAAKYLGRGEGLLRQAVQDGQVPSVLLGARRWVSVESLKKMVEGSLKDRK